MRDRLIITVTDLEGSQYFNVHQIVKKIGLIILFFSMVSFASGSFIIKTLVNTISSLEYKKGKLKELTFNHEQNISELNSLIGQKNVELKKFTDTLKEIELLIGLKGTEYATIQERVDTVKLGTGKRLQVLRKLPSESPLSVTTVTDEYGWRIHPISKRRVFHKGIDLRAKMNTDVYTSAEGVVEYAGYNKKSGFGKLVVISHNYGFKSYYAHLNKISVKAGDIVSKGQQIALSGNTGRSNGPHLHYEIRHVGILVNPINFINWNIDNYESIFTTTTEIKWQSLVNLIAKS